MSGWSHRGGTGLSFLENTMSEGLPLVVDDDLKLRLKPIDAHEANLAELLKQADFIPNMEGDGYKKSKEVSQVLQKAGKALDDTRKEIKEPLLNATRQIDARAKEVAEQLAEARQPHLEAYREHDRLEKERKEKEAKRIDDRINEVRNAPLDLRDHDAETILEQARKFKADGYNDCGTRTKEALEAREKTVAALMDMHQKALESEAERAELEKLRKENEARDAEAAEEKRKADEERDAELARLRAENEKLQKAVAPTGSNEPPLPGADDMVPEPVADTPLPEGSDDHVLLEQFADQIGSIAIPALKTEKGQKVSKYLMESITAVTLTCMNAAAELRKEDE